MKKIVNLLASLVICTASVSVFAANQAPAVVSANTANPAAKVGVLDMRQVMERSTQIAQIKDKLQKEYKPKQDKLLAAQNTLKNDGERLRRDNAIMNNSDRKQLEQKIINEQQELQTMQANFQRELMTDQNRELKVFFDNVKVIIEKVANTENLGLVITKETVAFVKPDLDITEKVIQQLPHK